MSFYSYLNVVLYNYNFFATNIIFILRDIKSQILLLKTVPNLSTSYMLGSKEYIFVRPADIKSIY